MSPRFRIQRRIDFAKKLDAPAYASRARSDPNPENKNSDSQKIQLLATTAGIG
jgi:hypothetical protein